MRLHQSSQNIGLWRQGAKKTRSLTGGNQHRWKVIHVDAIDQGSLIFHIDPHESHARKFLRNLVERVSVIAAG